MRKTLLATSISLGLLAMNTSASSDSAYSAMYTFGDSLYDTGQYDGTRFTNRVGPDYQTSAFGPVSPDLVSQGLKLPVTGASRFGGNNYAVGSNRSIDTLNSITAATTYTQAYADTAPPERDTTFNSLFYNLELAGRTLDTEAIYMLDGGGNDIGDGLVFSDADAAVVATNMVDAANALKARGAKYVVVTYVPDFGLAPAGVGFADFATGLAGSVNRQIGEQIGGANILIFDSFTVLQEVAANPSAFGLNLTSSELSRSCFNSPSPACTQGSAAAKIDGSNPDPSQFFFNDPLHATTIGQQISADYLLSVLLAPAELSQLPEMGIDDMQSHWRAARPAMRSNRWTNNTEVGAYTVWGGVNRNDNERDTDYGSTANNTSTQYAVGYNYRVSDAWYLGGMISRADNQLDFDSGSSQYDMQSLDFSLLSGFRGEHWFAEGVLSYSSLDYDRLRRGFNLGPVNQRTESADTKGDSLGALINAGYNLFDSSSALRLGPMLGYEYVTVNVDGYTEEGSSATALNIDEQDVSSGVWSAGVFADYNLGFCNCELYSDVVYRKDTEADANDLAVGLVNVAGNMATLPGFEREDDSWRWNVGLAANLTPALQLNVSGGGEQADSADNFWYGAEISYSF
jgi:outer membrane lipase/esterase